MFIFSSFYVEKFSYHLPNELDAMEKQKKKYNFSPNHSSTSHKT